MPVLVDEEGMLLAGEARVNAAAKLGLNSIPVIVARSWSEEEKRAYRLADNQLAARASWDPEQLRNELRELESAGFDVDLIGFDPDQLETILATLGSSGLTDPDSVPEVLDQPVAGLGDIWQLGDHRVGCGDSTIAADVASVLAGSTPHLMIADPPYGVSYEPSWRARRKLIYGGAAGGGKTVGLILEPLRHVGRIANFTAVFFRRTTPQITNPGALWDESLNFYRWVGGTPHVGVHEWRWPRAGKIKFSHLQLESTIFYDWQSAQITLICFDELTQFTAHQFFYMVSRNRSTCGVRSYIRATCNPDADSWVAEFVAWWIDQETGLPIPERAGVLRYYIRVSGKIVWADRAEDLMQYIPTYRGR
jgi:hypothetical protein